MLMTKNFDMPVWITLAYYTKYLLIVITHIIKSRKVTEIRIGGAVSQSPAAEDLIKLSKFLAANEK